MINADFTLRFLERKPENPGQHAPVVSAALADFLQAIQRNQTAKKATKLATLSQKSTIHVCLQKPMRKIAENRKYKRSLRPSHPYSLYNIRVTFRCDGNDYHTAEL